MLQSVLESYRAALRRWLPIVVAHAFVRLFVTTLLAPLIGLLLASTLLFSDQTALTDQDIARFLLTPAGAIGALVVLSFVIVAGVLDVVVATAILRQRTVGPLGSLRVATEFILQAVPRLLSFVARFLVRVLLIALPFLAVSGIIALVMLTAHDINYYLSERPPEFLNAVVLIGIVLLGLGATLLWLLTGWAISMHLSLFEGVPPGQSFAESRTRMTGHRRRLASRIACWLALRAILASLIGACVGVFVSWVAGQGDVELSFLLGSIIVAAFVWSVLNLVLNAISNGALADILNDELLRALAGRQPNVDVSEFGEEPGKSRAHAAVILGVAALSVVGLVTGGVFTNRLKQDAAVEIIAHRGAAALAPENTLASVDRAIADGADWIEIDVQESADGTVIVAHDSDFMKAAQVPTKVWDVTQDELERIDVGSWFDPEFSDERVPTLRQVLTAARGRARVIIELKYYGHDVDLENRVAAIVEDTGMEDHVSTMSLKYPAVQKMRVLRPDWRAGVLAATSVGDVAGLEGDFLALNQGGITPGLTDRAARAGKQVYAWTVNDPVSVVRMIWVGVDGLITDDPARTRSVVAFYNDLSLPERMLLAASDRINLTLDPNALAETRP